MQEGAALNFAAFLSFLALKNNEFGLEGFEIPSTSQQKMNHQNHQLNK